MSSNQLHGKKIEDQIKATFQGASDSERSPQNKWDIEARFDRELNLPTNIKTVKYDSSLVIGLADARRFMELNENFRLYVAIYLQEKERKKFYEIREYLITREHLFKIKNELTYSDVESYHLALKTIPNGRNNELKKNVVSDFKNRFKDKQTLLRLNPKVDSGNQRRLQCSINLNDLDKITQPKLYKEGDEFRDTYYLPIVIKSSSREFNKGN